MNAHRQLAWALGAIVFVTIVGTFGFHWIEDLSLFGALWMTLITVLTVGYGDASPHTLAGKIFAMFMIPIGIGIATYAMGALTAAIVEGDISKTVRRRRMEKSIDKLNGHVIVCGLGRVGRQVVAQLQLEKADFVVIDRMAGRKEPMPEGILYLDGDATEDTVLLKAGIERASGLVATLPQDAENVYIALTAKGIKPGLNVVARSERPESEDKLRRAGADKVINPSSIGGRRLALSLLKPMSVDYVDTILHAQDKAFIVEELTLGGQAPFLGMTLQDSRVRQTYGITVIAIIRSGAVINNPRPEEKLLAGDVVIVFGAADQISRFEAASGTARSKGLSRKSV